MGRDGLPAGIYAQKVLSDEGSHNDLYWKAEDGEAESPVGPFVATAAAEGYRAGVVYQKDMGEETDATVAGIETFDPDAT